MVLDHPLLAFQDVSTDGEGEFKVSDVPAGCDYEMHVQAGTWDAKGRDAAWVFGRGPKSVVVDPGRTIDVGEIQFDDAPLPPGPASTKVLLQQQLPEGTPRTRTLVCCDLKN